LKGDQLAKLDLYKNTLQILKISNNKISDIKDLDSLKGFGKLIKLDLGDNEVCEADDYRTKVFETLPALMVLDGHD